MAQVRGAPIYVVTEVVLLPLTSQSEAEKVILQAKQSQSRESRTQDEHSLYCDDISDDDYDQSEEDFRKESACPVLPTSEPSTVPGSNTAPADLESNVGVAHDIIGRKGQYGRFAERWFFKQGWSNERRRVLGMSTDGDGSSISSSTLGIGFREPCRLSSTVKILTDSTRFKKESAPRPPITLGVTNPLLPKLVRTTKLLLGSRSFFFSYDCDITRRLGRLEAVRSDIPTHKSVNPLVRSQVSQGQHNLFVSFKTDS